MNGTSPARQLALAWALVPKVEWGPPFLVRGGTPLPQGLTDTGTNDPGRGCWDEWGRILAASSPGCCSAFGLVTLPPSLSFQKGVEWFTLARVMRIS